MGELDLPVARTNTKLSAIDRREEVLPWISPHKGQRRSYVGVSDMDAVLNLYCDWSREWGAEANTVDCTNKLHVIVGIVHIDIFTRVVERYDGDVNISLLGVLGKGNLYSVLFTGPQIFFSTVDKLPVKPICREILRPERAIDGCFFCKLLHS